MPKLILVLFGCLSESAEYSHECLVVKCEQLNWCLCWFRETQRVATDHNMLVLYGIMSYMDFDMAGHMKVMK